MSGFSKLICNFGFHFDLLRSLDHAYAHKKSEDELPKTTSTQKSRKQGCLVPRQSVDYKTAVWWVFLWKKISFSLSKLKLVQDLRKNLIVPTLTQCTCVNTSKFVKSFITISLIKSSMKKKNHIYFLFEYFNLGLATPSIVLTRSWNSSTSWNPNLRGRPDITVTVAIRLRNENELRTPNQRTTTKR